MAAMVVERTTFDGLSSYGDYKALCERIEQHFQVLNHTKLPASARPGSGLLFPVPQIKQVMAVLGNVPIFQELKHQDALLRTLASNCRFESFAPGLTVQLSPCVGRTRRPTPAN